MTKDFMMEQNAKMNLLFNGEEAFSRIIYHIQNAQKEIKINMFIWRDDKIGNIIAEEILAAANRGIKITIVKDKQGEVFEKAEETKQSFFHKQFKLGSEIKAKLFDTMYPALGKAKSSKQKPNLLALKLLTHQNIYLYKEEILNDHSKYYIFDNQVLIMGGMNIEDKEIYTDVSGIKYCDYMVEMIGTEYVLEFQEQLIKGTFAKQEPVMEFIYNVKRKRTQIINAKREILKLINSATSSIVLVMAYFGDRDVTEALIKKALSGVKITIITSQKANIQHDLNMSTLRKIMKETNNLINLYLSRKMIHAKMILLDGKVVTLGSINLNKAALRKMSEANVLVKHYQRGFNEKLETSIDACISESIKIESYNQLSYKKGKAFIEAII